MNLGNFCIAGHNYDNGTFFSNLNKLNLEDEIYIYDLDKNLVKYKIYDKYEISSTDTDTIIRNTNGIKELTLLTCNNFNR